MISSTQNKRIAGAVRLKKRALREKDRMFLVEGAQGVGEALSSQVPVRELFVSVEAEERYAHLLRAASLRGVPVHVVSPDVMDHLTSTVTPQGVVGVAAFVDVALEDVPANALTVAVLIEVRDPGNAGTILRSADAAGTDAVVVTRSSVDVYNPKTVRATAGSLFHVQLVRELDAAAAVAALRARGFAILAATARGRASIYEIDLRGPTAFLFGNEAKGLSDDVLGHADDSVRVPIAGKAESLNLAAAATLVLFESARQRAGSGR